MCAYLFMSLFPPPADRFLKSFGIGSGSSVRTGRGPARCQGRGANPGTRRSLGRLGWSPQVTGEKWA